MEERQEEDGPSPEVDDHGSGWLPTTQLDAFDPQFSFGLGVGSGGHGWVTKVAPRTGSYSNDHDDSICIAFEAWTSTRCTLRPSIRTRHQ